MNLKTLENDLAADTKRLVHDVRQFGRDTVHLSKDLAVDAKAETQHLADRSQRASIVERHFGFLAFAALIFLVLY